jgi:hypothetical protein
MTTKKNFFNLKKPSQNAASPKVTIQVIIQTDSGGGQRKQRLGTQEGFEKREWERNKVTENPSTYFPAGSGRACGAHAHAHAPKDQQEDLSFSLFLMLCIG